MKVNIVMTVKDRLDHTRQALESLVENTEPGTYNLTIVDDQSQEETREWVTRWFYDKAEGRDTWGEQLRLVSHGETLGVGGSKNNGVRHSGGAFGRGDFLCLSDNDVYFTAGWLDTLVKAMTALEDLHIVRPGNNPPEQAPPRVLLLGGCNHPYHQPEGELLLSLHEKTAVNLYGALGGASWLMRWETWDKYGPLPDNARGTCQSEDFAFCQRITGDGFKVGAVTPRVVIDCGKTDTFGKPIVGSEHYEDVEGVMIK